MLGLNISYYRKLKGLTQMQLAEAIDISRTHMSNIEAPNMPTSISLDTLLNIADTLDIPAASLLHFGSYSEQSVHAHFSSPSPSILRGLNTLRAECGHAVTSSSHTNAHPPKGFII